MAADLSSLFPPLYARWMGDLLQGPLPDESRSTCDDCAMCREPGVGMDQQDLFFERQVKCCGYRPLLVNFLVGRILADEDPAAAQGKASVRERIQAKVAVTPMGVSSSEAFLRVYHQRFAAEFGRSLDLRCPHFLDDGVGRCAIWKNRNWVCTTYFCKPVRGARGLDFWKGAMGPLLRDVEQGVARWCVLQVGLDAKALQALFPSNSAEVDVAKPDGKLDAERYARVWGQWLGREEDFFLECARRAEALEWKDVLQVCGSEVAVRASVVRDVYAGLASEALPERLTRGPVFVVRKGPSSTRVWARHPHDPIEVPNAVLAVLGQFRGRTTAEVLASVGPQAGLDEAMVRKLIDYGLLEEAV